MKKIPPNEIPAKVKWGTLKSLGKIPIKLIDMEDTIPKNAAIPDKMVETDLIRRNK